jgi:anti-sigma regulatory factor (Ser/Thr protein kinase)
MAVAPRAEAATQTQVAQTKNDRLANSSRIASVVGHELSAPLAAILGYAQTILSTKPEAPIAAAAESVLRESRRAREVVDKLLAFSGEAPVGKTSGRLSAVVAKVLKEFESRTTLKQVKVVKTLPSTSEIPLSSAGLEKAVRHLLENAVEAMERMPTKELHISLSESPDAIRLQIRDTGEGIPRENLARVTDPFFTTRSTPQNMGLGLSAAHGVFKEHGAEMKIESEPGKGTTVSVEFPRPQKKVAIGGAQVALKVEEQVRIPADLPKPAQPEAAAVPASTAGPDDGAGPRVLTPQSPAQVDIEGLLNMAEEAALEPVHEPHSAPPDGENGEGQGADAAGDELEIPAGLDFVEARVSAASARPASAAAASGMDDSDRTVVIPTDEASDFVNDGEDQAPARNTVDAPKFSAPKRERRLDQVKVEVRRPGAGNQG